MNTLDDQKADAWRFITAFYRQPGVEGACLHLQDDYGINVTFLLFLAWCEKNGLKAPATWQRLYRAGKWWRRAASIVRYLRRSPLKRLKIPLLAKEIALEKRQLFRLVAELEKGPENQTTREMAEAYLSERGAAGSKSGKVFLTAIN